MMSFSDFLYLVHLNRYPLMVGPIIGCMCAIVSVFVVLRRMSLISEGVSHAGFGGIGLAVLLAYFFTPLDNAVWRQVITGAFCMGTAFLMGYVSRKKKVSEDSAIGIFLAASVAVGQLLLKIRVTLPGGPKIPVDTEHLLFGDFVNVTATDTLLAGITALLVICAVAALYHQFIYITLDEEMARVNGVNTRLLNAILLMMISLVIVMCVKMVGFLMITALMIIPGATANMLSRRFGGVFIASILIGVLGTSAAVCLSIVPPFSRSSPGPIVVLLLFAIFAIVWAYRHFFKPRPINEPSPLQSQVEKEPGAFGHGHSH